MGEGRRKRAVGSRVPDATAFEPTHEMHGLIYALPLALLLWTPVLFFLF